MLRHCASLQCATQLALQHSHRLPARRLTALGISRTAPATAASLRTIRGLFTGDVPVPEAPQLFQDLDHGGGSNNSGGFVLFQGGEFLVVGHEELGDAARGSENLRSTPSEMSEGGLPRTPQSTISESRLAA